MKYFETKVVKVKKVEKKKEKCIHVGMAYAENKTGDSIECMNCGEYFVLEGKEQPKGNWVNSENLDKIKFPCFCSYKDIRGRKHYGMINKDFQDDIDTLSYNLVEIGKQDDCVNAIWDYYSLEDLFKGGKNIHILKGKIIIFEEE